nr:rpa2 [Cryptomonas curvata]
MLELKTYSQSIKRISLISKVHIESFNYAITQGLNLIVNNFLNHSVLSNLNQKVQYYIKGLYVSKPYLFEKTKKFKVIPRQCREISSSYKGDLISIISTNFNKNDQKIVTRIGGLPIMIKSLKCNLSNLNPAQLIEMDEEEAEIGGYFVLNGVEKMIRLLIIPKRNTVYVVSRLSNAERGKLCTTLSCSLRSVDRLQNSKTIHLHYMTSGSIYVRINVGRQEFFIPVVILLKGLLEISDKQLLHIFTNFNPKNNFLRLRGMTMLKDGHKLCDISTKKNVLNFLEKILSTTISLENSSKLDVSEHFFSEYLFIHLGSDNKSKFDLLLFMIQKLLFVYKGNSKEDNPDSIDSQEFLLPGHLYLIYLKERLDSCLSKNLNNFNKKKNCLLETQNFSLKNLEINFNSITLSIEKLISSGNIYSDFKGELSQLTGLSISIERLNFGRFISYFRSIHRGKFLSEIRGTAGRKLFPQSWGFLCPVHTPDGVLCGILNHLSCSVVVSLCNPIEKKYFEKLLIRNGLNNKKISEKPLLNAILLDGKILGFEKDFYLTWLVDKLRAEKVSKTGIIPIGTEIIYICNKNLKSGFPVCLCLSEEGRPLRPVLWSKFNENKNKKYKNNIYHELEMVGTCEQNLLNIRDLEIKCEKQIYNCHWTHSEVESGNILSIIAGMTPFSDLNQSPRNMYQCQMAKQSIGMPFYTFWRRDDVKSYFLLTPQTPICRNKIIQDGLHLDYFPNGANAVVTILSYTGFDLEDAMIINKSSIDRGFLMSNAISLSKFETKDFLLENRKNTNHNFIFKDGLPNQQDHVSRGDPLYLDGENNKGFDKKKISICYNGQEKTIVEKIKLISKLNEKKKILKYSVKLRCRRRPIIGDKFASRHGQKGVLSLDYSVSDLPFSELGIIPDIIFNPHGFPSRMTIGLILESLAGKSGSLGGIFHDSTSFRLAKKYMGTYQFSEKLRESGFQYYGNEIFYSGYSGEPLCIDIFTGIVQYQRLKHMVNDKFQVSESGPRNILTRQPIKGRKTGGAIRFGEMERDALLGHGSSFLLHDRLQLSSDLHSVKINIKTGSIIDLKFTEKRINTTQLKLYTSKTTFLPYVTKFLITELSVMNIKTILTQVDN